MLRTIDGFHAPHRVHLAFLALVVAGVVLLPFTSFVPFAAGQTKTQPPTGKNPGDTRSDRSGSTTPQGLTLGRFLVNDPAPEVNLNDHLGRTFQLSTERKAKPWLLVFIRHADELGDIQSIGPDVHELGIGAVIIAPFGRERVLERVKQPKLPVLFDRASVTARTYGVYDPVTANPRPGAFLVDRRGRIVWFISGGLPSGSELVRMTREALEKAESETAEGSAN